MSSGARAGMGDGVPAACAEPTANANTVKIATATSASSKVEATNLYLVSLRMGLGSAFFTSIGKVHGRLGHGDFVLPTQTP